MGSGGDEDGGLVSMPDVKWLAAAVCILSATLTAAPVTLTRSGDKVEIAIDGKAFTAYEFSAAVAKPFLMPLRTAAGIVISRSFPVANSVTADDRKTPSFEPHQRPLYFGHGNIDGLNFWSEEIFDHFYHGYSQGAYGRMALLKLENMNGGPEAGSLQARFKLLAPGNRTVAEEVQTFQFHGDDRTRTVDCEFVILANHGAVTFGDTKEGTFAVRLNAELSAPRDHMLNSNGAQGEAAIWGKPADWVSYSGTVAGKPVGIAVFDGPKSFRHPTTWHARAYGLLAANPFGAREFTKDPNKDGSWTVPEGQSIKFQYRVVIYDGQFSPAQLAALYHAYAQSH
jgi:hypothetical protein